jgi:hypothetical protein
MRLIVSLMGTPPAARPTPARFGQRAFRARRRSRPGRHRRRGRDRRRPRPPARHSGPLVSAGARPPRGAETPSCRAVRPGSSTVSSPACSEPSAATTLPPGPRRPGARPGDGITGWPAASPGETDRQRHRGAMGNRVSTVSTGEGNGCGRPRIASNTATPACECPALGPDNRSRITSSGATTRMAMSVASISAAARTNRSRSRLVRLVASRTTLRPPAIAARTRRSARAKTMPLSRGCSGAQGDATRMASLSTCSTRQEQSCCAWSFSGAGQPRAGTARVAP